jgi:hypothetical protein
MLPKVKKIHEKIAKLNNELRDLQANCPHDNADITPGANTGNYDPSADCYWMCLACHDCGHRETAYSDINRERYYYLAGKRNK